MRITALSVILILGAGGAQAQQDVRDETGILPEGWSIDEELRNLQSSMGDFNRLIQSLGTANSQLQDLLTKHLKSPADRVNGSALERALAAYAENGVRDFDRIIANQDATLYNFRALNRKLNRFNAYLKVKIDTMKQASQEAKKKMPDMEKQLEELAVKVKHGSPEEAKEAKREFSRIFHRYQIQKRYANGYGKNEESYRKLSEHLTSLNGHFGTLKDKFSVLVENLEAEKDFLQDNMALQEDSMKVRAMIQDGILDGHDAIGKVTEKMAVLFLKVNAFNSINERVNQTLDGFMDFQEHMVGLGEKLQQIGLPGTPESLDQAIDDFYNRRYGLEEEKKEETHVEPKK